MSRVCFAAVLLLFAASNLPAAEPTPLMAGDRIVFFGDSITGLGAREEHGYVNIIRAALDEKLPELKVECLGAGQSGNNQTLTGYFTRAIWTGLQSKNNRHLPDFGVYSVSLVN